MRDRENQASMETVLASIREMIQDDEKQNYMAPQSGHARTGESVKSSEKPIPLSHSLGHSETDEEEDILDLNHQIQEDGSVKNIESHGDGGFLKENALEGWDISSSVMDKFHAGSNSPKTSSKSVDSDGIVSKATEKAARSSFEKLADTIQEISQEEQRVQSRPSITVEDMVLKALRPILKEWVDDNLPSLAENLVSKEIKKLMQRIRPE